MSSGLWLIALLIIPAIAGVVSHWKFHSINIKEAGISFGAALVLCGMTLLIGKCSMHTDTETHSGHITSVQFIPEWESHWVETVTHTETDSKGNTTTTTEYVDHYDTHHEEWIAHTTLGQISVSKSTWDEIKNRFGYTAKRGSRPDYDSGDKNDYWSTVQNKNHYPEYPVTRTLTWQNKYKNTDSIVVGEPMTDEEAQGLGLPSYPKARSNLSSARLVGSTFTTTYRWDQLNSVVGPRDHVNLLLVKIGTVEQATKLRQYWQNGKKNDLVICYNGDAGKPADWCYIFGWSKSEIVKQNLESILLDNPLDDRIIELIDKELGENYESYDWESVEVTSNEVPTWAVITAFILMIVSQVGCYIYFHHNEI